MSKINNLLHKEMTRKEFLATLGFGIATLFGMSTIINLFTDKQNPLEQRTNSLGYGQGSYGGQPRA